MTKKSEMNRLQRGGSRRNRRGRTSKEDKMKTPPGRNNGIRKPRKTNRRRTKRRRTKRSMNEGKGEAGGWWGLPKKTKIMQVVKKPPPQVTATANPNEVMFTLEGEKDENYKNNLVNELLILLEKNNADNDEDKRLLLALESCKKREMLKIEYMLLFNILRETLRNHEMFDENNDTSEYKQVYAEQAMEPDFINSVRKALDGISKRERSGKPLTLEQISKINKIMGENTKDALRSVPQSQTPEN